MSNASSSNRHLNYSFIGLLSGLFDFQLKLLKLVIALICMMSSQAMSSSNQVGLAATAVSTKPYGAYTLYSQGSGRVMAMGGVFSSLSDGANSLTLNPSGAALANWTVDAAASNTIFNDSAAAPTGTFGVMGTQSSEAFSYQAFAVAGRVGSFVFGLGTSTPYQFSYDDTSSNHAKMSITSYDAMLAVQLGEYFSVGICGHMNTLTEKLLSSLVNSNNGIHVDSDNSTTVSGNSFSAGATFRTKKSGLGITYFQPQTYSVDPTLPVGVNNVAYFRDVVVPSLVVFGGFYRLNSRILVSVDVDQFSIPSNTVDPLSGVNTSFYGDVQLTTGNLQVLHGGFEWVLATEKNMDIIFRGGAYQEPARYLKGDSRFHRTFGLQVRFGLAVLNVSFDQSANFDNTSQGFSLVLGAL